MGQVGCLGGPGSCFIKTGHLSFVPLGWGRRGKPIRRYLPAGADSDPFLVTELDSTIRLRAEAGPRGAQMSL